MVLKDLPSGASGLPSTWGRARFIFTRVGIPVAGNPTRVFGLATWAEGGFGLSCGGHWTSGAWLSLVERFVRDEEVGGSNPLAPMAEFWALVEFSTGARLFL